MGFWNQERSLRRSATQQLRAGLIFATSTSRRYKLQLCYLTPVYTPG